MRGMGQWASGPESWGPTWDPPRKKKEKEKLPPIPNHIVVDSCAGRLLLMLEVEKRECYMESESNRMEVESCADGLIRTVCKF